MKILTLSFAFAALVAAAPASAFSVYELQSDGSAAHYLLPGAKSGSGLQLNNDNQQDNGITLYQSGDSNFSMSGGTSYYGNAARPNSLTHQNRGARDSNAPFTGYYLRDR